jgi:hypothetical protein
MKIGSASSTRSLTCWAPWTSILRMTSCPSASASRTSWRGVVPIAVHLVGLEQGARVPKLEEPLPVEEW